MHTARRTHNNYRSKLELECKNILSHFNKLLFRLFCAAYSKEGCRNGLRSPTNQPFPAMAIMICSSMFQTLEQLHQEDVGIHSNSQYDIYQCGSEYSVVISTVADRKCII